MGRPRGHRLSQESKDKIRESVRARYRTGALKFCPKCGHDLHSKAACPKPVKMPKLPPPEVPRPRKISIVKYVPVKRRMQESQLLGDVVNVNPLAHLAGITDDDEVKRIMMEQIRAIGDSQKKMPLNTRPQAEIDAEITSVRKIAGRRKP